MDQETRASLNAQSKKGRAALRAYNSFIKPFVEEKRVVLFEAFQAVSIEETEKLKEVKRQLMAVNALDEEIQSIINSGKLSDKQLESVENEE